MKKHSVEVGPILGFRSHPELWTELVEAIQGKRVYYLRPQTRNIGTELSIIGTIQFFHDHGVTIANDWQRDELPDVISGIDCLVYGGGMVGTSKEKGSSTRRWIVHDYLNKHDLPLVCLPMSHLGSDEPRPPGEFTMFSREEKSLEHLPGSRMAPDMAFYFERMVPTHYSDGSSGVFLREDHLSYVSKYWRKGLGDPIGFAKTLDDYFDLASRFDSILTDRLMFAICGILLDRTVTLLPDVSGKNKAVYDAWLSDLCQWSDPGVLLQ